ncbi:unnamed protein product [Cuscuta epithymum]|uniref:Uncharacterized protein n=1 Tax=Cuscuta epithymum TaxID=186058 RepID=A0AAV0D6P3_9ASTE|nr:unnamed protein product [Cuscuta epithymum]
MRKRRAPERNDIRNKKTEIEAGNVAAEETMAANNDQWSDSDCMTNPVGEMSNTKGKVKAVNRMAEKEGGEKGKAVSEPSTVDPDFTTNPRLPATVITIDGVGTIGSFLC